VSIRRLDILSRFVSRFDYTSYLEVGVAGGSTFKRMQIRKKVGVDPKWRLWTLLDPRIKKTTSDRFFARNRRSFDLVFIDGLHVAEQTYRDLRNALAALNPGGAIVVHDCMPTTKEEQAVPRSQISWTGDVWRAFLKVSGDPELETLILDTDRGCGVIRRGPRPAGAPMPPDDLDPLKGEELSWEEYVTHRHRWLRIHPPEETFSVIDGLV